MKEQKEKLQVVKQTNVSRMLLVAACFVVIVAGMRAAQAILVPFLLSIFIAIICGPMLIWLRQKGLSTGLALLAVILAVLAAGTLFGVLVGSSVHDFSQSLPLYQERLAEKTAALVGFLSGYGLKLSENSILNYLDPSAAMGLASNLLTGIGGMLSNAFLILLTVIFILMEASSFPAKLQAAFGTSGKYKENLERVVDKVNSYMAIKTWVSLATGVLIAVWLFVIGVDFPLLWGTLAFLLNYVPNIGSIIAAVPAILLALIQRGSTTALLAAAGFAVVNVIIGSVIEPRFMGKGLGLSTLVVFLSLVFWGWVLGPVGMLLSMPLTMAVRIALATSEETRWVSIMLGTDSKTS